MDIYIAKLHRFLQLIMLFKIVLEKQIRVFDCKETPSLELIHIFIRKTFPHLKKYSLYYLDEDQDQISLEDDADLKLYIQEESKKPKIFIQENKSDVVFDSTVKIQLDKHPNEKGQEPNLILKKQEQDENKQDLKAFLQEKPKVEQPETEPQKVEHKKQQVHPALCDHCGADPIQGTRFKCSVCEDYDLCQQCESNKGHSHPLIKIRLPIQAPLDCKVEMQQDPAEAERKKAMAQRLKNSAIGKKQKMVYESFVQRQQIIISYLGSLLGEEEFSKYKDFSKVCKSDTYEDLIEEYLHWLEDSKGSIQKVINWIKKQFQAITKFKEEHLA